MVGTKKRPGGHIEC